MVQPDESCPGQRGVGGVGVLQMNLSHCHPQSQQSQPAQCFIRMALEPGLKQGIGNIVQEERDRAQKQAAAAAIEEVEEEEEPVSTSPSSAPTQPAGSAATSSQPQTTHSAAAASPTAASEESAGPAFAHPTSDGVHRLEAVAEQEEVGGLEIRRRPTSESEAGGLESGDQPAVGDQAGAATLSGHVRGMVAKMDAGKQSGRPALYAPSQRALLTRDQVKQRGAAPNTQGTDRAAASADDQVILDAHSQLSISDATNESSIVARPING